MKNLILGAILCLLHLLSLGFLSAQINFTPSAIQFIDPTIRIEQKNIDELHIKNLWDLTISGRPPLKGKIYQQADQHAWINLEGDTAMVVNQYGKVKLPYLERDMTGYVWRPLYIRRDGQLMDPPYITQDIHYASFIPGGDGDDLGDLNVVNTNGHRLVYVDGDIADNGEMIAPITLPRNAQINSVTVYYINASDQTMEFSIQREDKALNNQLVAFGKWYKLESDGVYNSPLQSNNSIASKTVNITDVPTNPNYLYSFVVRCEDCSLQLIKGVSLSYTIE